MLGGAPGLLIGTLIHGRGWVAVGAVIFVAGVSSILARLGGTGSVTGLQLFVYSALGLGPLGALRPWWHTALQFLAGVAWALLLITPGYLLSPRSAERKAVAEVYYALARGLRLIGTPGVAGARTALAAALNAAYDAMLTRRAYAGGRSRRDMHLMAVLNVSHQFAEAAAALRATGERVPPLVTDDDRAARRRGTRRARARVRRARPRRAAGAQSDRAGAPRRARAAADTAAVVVVAGRARAARGHGVLARVLSGNWTPRRRPGTARQGRCPRPARPGAGLAVARGRAADRRADRLGVHPPADDLHRGRRRS